MGLLCLALWPGTTHGQSLELIDTYDRFARFYIQGRDQAALRFAGKALRLGEYEFGPDHPIAALLLNNLAGLHDARGHDARGRTAPPALPGDDGEGRGTRASTCGHEPGELRRATNTKER